MDKRIKPDAEPEVLEHFLRDQEAIKEVAEGTWKSPP